MATRRSVPLRASACGSLPAYAGTNSTFNTTALQRNARAIPRVQPRATSMRYPVTRANSCSILPPVRISSPGTCAQAPTHSLDAPGDPVERSAITRVQGLRRMTEQPPAICRSPTKFKSPPQEEQFEGAYGANSPSEISQEGLIILYNVEPAASSSDFADIVDCPSEQPEWENDYVESESEGGSATSEEELEFTSWKPQKTSTLCFNDEPEGGPSALEVGHERTYGKNLPTEISQEDLVVLYNDESTTSSSDLAVIVDYPSEQPKRAYYYAEGEPEDGSPTSEEEREFTSWKPQKTPNLFAQSTICFDDEPEGGSSALEVGHERIYGKNLPTEISQEDLVVLYNDESTTSSNDFAVVVDCASEQPEWAKGGSPTSEEEVEFTSRKPPGGSNLVDKSKCFGVQLDGSSSPPGEEFSDTWKTSGGPVWFANDPSVGYRYEEYFSSDCSLNSNGSQLVEAGECLKDQIKEEQLTDVSEPNWDETLSESESEIGRSNEELFAKAYANAGVTENLFDNENCEFYDLCDSYNTTLSEAGDTTVTEYHPGSPVKTHLEKPSTFHDGALYTTPSCYSEDCPCGEPGCLCDYYKNRESVSTTGKSLSDAYEHAGEMDNLFNLSQDSDLFDECDGSQLFCDPALYDQAEDMSQYPDTEYKTQLVRKPGFIPEVYVRPPSVKYQRGKIINQNVNYGAIQSTVARTLREAEAYRAATGPRIVVKPKRTKIFNQKLNYDNVESRVNWQKYASNGPSNIKKNEHEMHCFW